MIERLLYLGATHKTAALTVREQLAAGPERVPGLLSELRRLTDEALVLNTCGRFEIYLVMSMSRQEDWPAWLGPILRQPASLLLEHMSMRTGKDAVGHALRVAAGLESRLIGEDQILGQIRRAFDLAMRRRAVGPMLSALFRAAIHAGRRVRTETELGRRSRSFARLAVEVVRSELSCEPAHSTDGKITNARTILILGTGSLARDVAEELKRNRYTRLRFVSRHIGRAQQLAAEYHGEGYGLDALPSLLRTCDAVIACASSMHALISPWMFEGAGVATTVCAEEWSGHAVPLTIVDLGVPRNVDPAVAALPGIVLRDLDAIQPPEAEYEESVIAAEQIVDHELRRYLDWLRGRAAAPRITQLLCSAGPAADMSDRAVRRALHQRILQLKKEVAA